MYKLSELDIHSEDEQVLPQSTVFKDRVFLPKISERSLVCALVGDQLSKDDFLLSPDIESVNGQLVLDLVEFLDESGPEVIQPAYKRFLKNVCKSTSVRGLLQVTNFLPLNYISSFCKEYLALKDLGNIEKLRMVRLKVSNNKMPPNPPCPI